MWCDVLLWVIKGSWREQFLERKMVTLRRVAAKMKRKGGDEEDDFELGFQGGALVTVRVHSLARAPICAA